MFHQRAMPLLSGLDRGVLSDDSEKDLIYFSFAKFFMWNYQSQVLQGFNFLWFVTFSCQFNFSRLKIIDESFTQYPQLNYWFPQRQASERIHRAHICEILECNLALRCFHRYILLRWNWRDISFCGACLSESIQEIICVNWKWLRPILDALFSWEEILTLCWDLLAFIAM